MPSKNTTYNQYVHGDFDKDGTPNIDDSRPFDKNNSEPAQEVSLSDELKKIQAHNQSYKTLVKAVKKRFKGRKIKFRIKRTHSTIGKLRRKYIDKLTDLVGIIIICKNKDDISETAKQVYKSFNVIQDKDYYKTGKKGNKYYKARHLIVQVRNKPVEIQLKTVGHYELSLSTHPIYKKYGKIPKNMYSSLLKQSNNITNREG